MADSSGADQASPSLSGVAAWFPQGRLDLPGWRFDVITLLAVIGESSVAVHAQTMTASALCLLPRIIPAPQALLRPVRPQRLPEVTAKMAAVYGGTVLDTVGFFANIIHPLDELKPYAFKVLEIKHTESLMSLRGASAATATATTTAMSGPDGLPLYRRWIPRRRASRDTTATAAATSSSRADGENEGGLSKGKSLGRTPGSRHVTFSPDTQNGPNDNDNNEDLKVSSAPRSPGTAGGTPEEDQEDEDDPGKRRLQRRTTTISEKMTDFMTNPTMVNKHERYAVPPAYYSPLHAASILSFGLTVGILGVVGHWKDGTAMVAILLLAVASTVTCYASWWRPLLMHRPATSRVPPGDVVIRTREGAFVLIKCNEEVARELYCGTEECQYVSTKYHRFFMGIGMVLLMVAVVLLGNCSWSSQALIGASYIVLNALYWLMGLVPPKFFWWVPPFHFPFTFCFSQ